MFNLDLEELDKEHRSNRLGAQKRPCKLKEQLSQGCGGLRDEGASGGLRYTLQAEEGQKLLGATFGSSYLCP